MDQATLSPVDRELVATHPDVDEQLIELSRKLEAIRTNVSSSSTDVTPENLLMHYNSMRVSEPNARGSSSDYGTLAMDSRNNDSDFTCDNVAQGMCFYAFLRLLIFYLLFDYDYHIY